MASATTAREKISPGAIAKLKAGQDHVPIDSPEAVPFLMAMESVLRRWFSVDLERVARFYNVSLSESGECGGTVEVIFTAPVPGKPNSVEWEWWGGFDGFGVDGVFCVDLEPETMEESPCVHRWHQENEKHGREMDLHFDVVRRPGGKVEESVSVRVPC